MSTACFEQWRTTPAARGDGADGAGLSGRLLRGRRRRQRHHDPRGGLDLRRRRDRELLPGRPRLRARDRRGAGPGCAALAGSGQVLPTRRRDGGRGRPSPTPPAGRSLACEATALLMHPADRRADQHCSSVTRGRRAHSGTDDRGWPGSGTSSSSCRATGAGVPLQEPRHRCAEGTAMPETLDLSIFVRHDGDSAHMELAVEGVGCAGCIRKIEQRAEAAPGHRRRAAEFHQPPPGGRLAAGGDRRRRRHRGARAHRLSRPSVRAGTRGSRRGAAGALAACAASRSRASPR